MTRLLVVAAIFASLASTGETTGRNNPSVSIAPDPVPNRDGPTTR